MCLWRGPVSSKKTSYATVTANDWRAHATLSDSRTRSCDALAGSLPRLLPLGIGSHPPSKKGRFTLQVPYRFKILYAKTVFRVAVKSAPSDVTVTFICTLKLQLGRCPARKTKSRTYAPYHGTEGPPGARPRARAHVV